MIDEEGKVAGERKGSKNKKIAAIIIVIILIQVSFIAIWYVYYRPWTIRDVANTCNVSFEDVNSDTPFLIETEVESPSFSRDLAGNSKKVKGRITNIITYETTLGPLTSYELDNFEHIHLIEWAPPRYDEGDVIEKKVYFQWSRWNEDENVYSPQLDFPALIMSTGIGQLVNTISLFRGLFLEVNQTESEGQVIISVFLPKGEGFPLELFNCSLREGVSSWMEDYEDTSVGYWRNPVIDSMPSLLNGSGGSNQVVFTDANYNGILDDGDYFTFNLTEPEEDSGILTYILSINGGVGHLGGGVLSGQCYIIMTNRGVLGYISYSDKRSEISPYYILDIISENRTHEGIETILNVSQVIGEAQVLSECDMHFISEDSSLSGYPLNDIAQIGMGVYRIESSDNNENGILDIGDQIILSKLRNLREYEFKLSGTSHDIIISQIRWRAGIGVYTGSLPIIEVSNNAIDNTSHEVTIERMYGIPGLNVDHDNLERGPFNHRINWIMIHLERNDTEILSPANLTQNFNITIEDANLTFIDSDDNLFINSGDSFIFHGSLGTYRLTLDYVERDYREEEGFRILLSQSFSWTI